MASVARDINFFKQTFFLKVVITALLASSYLLNPATAKAQTAPAQPEITPVPVETKAAEPASEPTENKEPAPENDGSIKLLGDGGMENFYTWIEGAGVFIDPKGIFTLQDGILRITGERTGYLATRKEHSDFHLVAEYKWGQMTTAHPNKIGSSGLFIHGTGEDKEWMRGFECQLATNRSGNLVIHGGAKCKIGTNSFSRTWTEINKSPAAKELAAGEWNTMEVFAVGDKLRVLVNGKQAMEATDLLPNRGKIYLQSNGAEIFFRRLDLYPLEKMPEAPAEEVSKTAAK